ncbi:MAG: hypothetical protein AB7N24_13690 [Dehalococcoidia bacterium]
MNNDRLITVGGIAFAALTLAGIFMVLPGIAGGDTTNAEAAAWMQESAHRARAIAGAYLMCAGAVAMVVFLAGVTGRLRASQAAPGVIEVARLAGLSFVVCQLVAAIAMAGVAYAVSSGNEPTPIDPGATRISTFGLAVWLIPGMISAALFTASVAIGALTTKAFPAWVGLSGLLLAAILLAAITFLPALLLMVWSAAVALVAMVHHPADAPIEMSAAPT